MANDTWRTEWIYQIKTRLERLDKKETYQYLGILEADTIKWVEMKEKIKKECNILAEDLVLYILPLGLVRLRTFRLNTWVS